MSLLAGEPADCAAAAAAVDAEYRVLLRHAVESFFPKPLALRSFEWLNQNTISNLETAGFTDTEELYTAVASNRASLLGRTGIKAYVLSEIALLSDWVGAYWVSPAFAGVLLVAGSTDAKALASSDPDHLLATVSEANTGSRFYKGKLGMLGMLDMGRLTAAPAYIPTEYLFHNVRSCRAGLLGPSYAPDTSQRQVGWDLHSMSFFIDEQLRVGVPPHSFATMHFGFELNWSIDSWTQS